MEEETFQERAMYLVQNYLADNFESGYYELKLVWFCKTLKNWKAMIADIGNGGMFFEVTYNGDKEETYIDAYKKHQNVVVPD